MDEKIGTGVAVGGTATMNGIESESVAAKTIYHFECLDSAGNLKWKEFAENTVVNVGLDDLLDKYFKGSTYTAAHYVGLTDGTPTPAAGDTMSSHAGWVEVTDYLNSPDVRPTLTLGTVSSQSVDNSASKASFAMAGASPDSITIGGAFITTDSTKGGTSGTLYSIAAFSGGDKTLNNGDTLNVTATLTAASA